MFQLPNTPNCKSLAMRGIAANPAKKLSYAFLVIQKNEKVRLHYSDQRVTGILSVFNTVNLAVSNYGKQVPPTDIGVETFEFWVPKRRPNGQNLALKFDGREMLLEGE